MDARLELDIRKGYSAYYAQFEGLSIWIDSLLTQLTFHDPLVYSFDVRIKTIESLLEKVEARLEDKEPFTCFDDVRERIKDLVGARVLVYVPDALRKVHALLLDMDSDRFDIKEIKIHYKEGRKTDIIGDIISTSSELLKPSEEPNRNGYVGVHYILHPVIKDAFYKQSPLKLFERFELQARTVMHHAWSEIQHRVIYKTDKPDYSDWARFADLADIISMCDDKLGSLSIEPARFTQTFRPEPPRATKFLKIIGDTQKVVTEFETKQLPDSERYDKAQKFLEKHERELAKLSDVSAGNIDANLELGELLLRGGHYEKAYELYVKCLAITERDGWVLLRLAETCDRLGKTDEALGYVRRLGDILGNKEAEDTTERDDVLYHGCAYLAWKYNLLDLAVSCAAQSIKLTTADNTSDMLKRSCNLIYYKTEQIAARYGNDWGQIEQYLVELAPTVQRVENMIDKVVLKSHHCDTLSWYYALRAESEKENGKKQQACKHIELAEELIEKCFVQWNKYESAQYDVDNAWRLHSIRIKKLKEKIEPC